MQSLLCLSAVTRCSPTTSGIHTPIVQDKCPSRRDMDLKGVATETWLLFGAVTATAAFVAVALFNPSAFDPKPNWDVSDGCLGGLETDENGELIHRESEISEHYHPKLKITVDGQFLGIPANTGIDQVGCREGMRWVHVHSAGANGQFTTLHVETPSRMNVPLGSFFEIWERHGSSSPALTEDRNFDINSNGISDWEEYEITMTVDGKSNTDYESFVMEDGDAIEITFTTKN